MVFNVKDFVQKVRKVDVCTQFFSYDDENYGGIKKMFEDFYEKVRSKMEQDKLLSTALAENMEEIAEYVMFNLHHEFFYNE